MLLFIVDARQPRRTPIHFLSISQALTPLGFPASFCSIVAEGASSPHKSKLVHLPLNGPFPFRTVTVFSLAKLIKLGCVQIIVRATIHYRRAAHSERLRCLRNRSKRKDALQQRLRENTIIVGSSSSKEVYDLLNFAPDTADFMYLALARSAL